MGTNHQYRGWAEGSSEGPRELEAGVDYSIWPAMKVQRARQLAMELRSSIEMFRVRMGTTIEGEVSEDGMAITFKPNLLGAPTHEWSLLFGDVIHNYRSSLDALVWALAHLDGATPRHPRRVQFPFAKTATEWKKLVTESLGGVSEEFLARLKLVQPFTRGNPQEAIGLTLHALDVQDKHHEALALELHPDASQGWAMKAAFAAEVPESVDPFGVFDWQKETPAVHGEPFGVWRPNVPAVSGTITALTLEVTTRVNGHVTSLDRILELSDLFVVGVFIAVEHGPQSHQYSEFSRYLAGLGLEYLGPPLTPPPP